MASSYLVGIDFGAVNIKAAEWNGKKIRPLDLNTDQMDGYETENIILYYKTEDGELDPRIGKRARQESFGSPEGDYVEDIKRKLEQKAWTQDIPCLGKTLRAEDIASDILAVIYDKVRKKHRNLEETSIEAAITVPVGFSAVQRARIRRAATAAGFHVRHVLTEPFAAAMSQNDLLKSTKQQNVLIFDFGGSTLDVSLLKIGRKGNTLKVEEAGAAGLHLGGLDFDAWIADEKLRPQFVSWLEEKDITPTSLEKQKADRALLRFAQTLKEKLFEEEDQDEDEEIGPEMMPFRLDFVPLKLRRNDVWEIFQSHQVSKDITEMLDEMFDDTEDIRPRDVDKVRIFGGTMHIRYFLDLLRKYFPDGILEDDYNTEDETIYTSVAEGAAQFLVNEENGTDADIKSYLPYTLGFLRQGGRFEPCIQHGIIGQPSLSKCVHLGDLDGGKLAVAQRFTGAQPVYVGTLPVDADMFSGDIIVQFSVDADETIHYRLTDFVDDDGDADEIPMAKGTVIIGEEETP